MQAIELPPSLDVLTHWPVIGISFALYLIEFVADKIPGIDLVWNALQTFVRVPAVALFAYAAAARLSPAEQLMTASPEPFSNIALSLGEDAAAVFIVWLAGRHPYWAAAIVAVAIVSIFALTRAVVRAARALFSGARRQLRA